jgi:hypothetical protein
MADGNDASQDRDQEARQVHERLAIPLLVPAIAFLFAVLVIYGLSRIYLELNETSIGDVTMATPAALGVSLFILLTAAYLASRPRVPGVQLLLIGMIAIGLLTGGSIWAAVHDEGGEEHVVVNGGTETPTGPGGGIQVGLHDPDFALSVDPASAPAGAVAFDVVNEGGLIHNFRAIKTDLAPDALPLDSTGFEVDESQVDVVASHEEIPAGASATVEADLGAGSYVLICNIPTHYEAGMHAAFSVE